MVERWDGTERALSALEQDRDRHAEGGYAVTGLGGEADPGFTAVYDDSSSYHELKCAFADDDLVFNVSIIDGPVDDGARLVCQDLGGHLQALAREHG